MLLMQGDHNMEISTRIHGCEKCYTNSRFALWHWVCGRFEAEKAFTPISVCIPLNHSFFLYSYFHLIYLLRILVNIK